MRLINRKYGDSSRLEFLLDISEHTTRTIADVADVYFSIKDSQDDADIDSLLFKTRGLTQIDLTAQADPTILLAEVSWAGTEYNAFTVGETYLGAIFIKWNGEATADENVEDDIFHIKIVADFLHEN